MGNPEPINNHRQPKKDARLQPSGHRRLVTNQDVRAELNIERWPGIWQPAKAKHKKTVRTLERGVTLPDGTSQSARIRIDYTSLGTLTTEDQKTLYALVQQWQDEGRPVEVTFFSTRALQRILKKTWGTNVIEAITGSLLRLRQTPLAWIDSFVRGKQRLEVLDPFTILDDLKIVTRKRDGHVTTQVGYFRLNRNILENLLANHSKPILLDVILGFRSEIAQLLYTHLDLIMSNKIHYQRRTQELFTDLGLKGTAYRKPGKRKQVLERAIGEISGVQLTTGQIVSARILKTKDGKDYKVVVRKAMPTAEDRGAEVETLAAKPDPAPSTETKGASAPAKPKAKEQAEELVRHFYQVFHGAAEDSVYPKLKELDQAESLIARHGFALSKHVINFSRGAAEETNFSPQTFGGILHYVTRGVADYEEAKRQEQHRRQQDEQARLQMAYQKYCQGRIDGYIADHPEESQALVQKHKQILLNEYAQRTSNMTDSLKDQVATAAAKREARTAIAEKLNLPSLEEFYRQRKAGRAGNQKAATASETPLSAPPTPDEALLT